MFTLLNAEYQSHLFHRRKLHMERRGVPVWRDHGWLFLCRQRICWKVLVPWLQQSLIEILSQLPLLSLSCSNRVVQTKVCPLKDWSPFSQTLLDASEAILSPSRPPALLRHSLQYRSTRALGYPISGLWGQSVGTLTKLPLCHASKEQILIPYQLLDLKEWLFLDLWRHLPL